MCATGTEEAVLLEVQLGIKAANGHPADVSSPTESLYRRVNLQARPGMPVVAEKPIRAARPIPSLTGAPFSATP